MDEPTTPSEEPLDDDEREQLHQDLVDVETLKTLLNPRGIKGAVFYCPDCDEDHYLAWDLLAGNLKELLEQGESPIHEPAFEPDPDEYVGWDYARGFLDGYETFVDEVLDDAVSRVAQELGRSGWDTAQIKSFLARAQLNAPEADEGSKDAESPDPSD